MKKILILISALVFCSCSSSRIEKQIISDFLDERFAIDKYTSSILVEEALLKTKALQYYENAFNERNLYEGEIHFAPLGYPPYTWEIDSLEIGVLKQKYKNDTITYHWKKSDFLNHKFKIYPYNTLRRRDNPEVGMNGIYLSKPLLRADKKHAFLFYLPFSVGIGSGEENAVLMKKVNGKWVILYNYNDTKYIN